MIWYAEQKDIKFHMNKQIKTKLLKTLSDHAISSCLRIPQIADKQQFIASVCNISLNYTNQHITTETLALLFTLAEQCGLRDKINALMTGGIVNPSENKPALHTALRAPNDTAVWVDGQDVMTEIIATRTKMKFIVEQIREKRWLGFSGKPITDIVNIGVGGSDLGPRFCLTALVEFTSPDFNYHFISDADPTSFNQVIAKLKPETTLFIISSKSFTTPETLYNAKKAIAWIDNPQHVEKHFIAVTANPQKANQFGINNVLPIWSWVGGRYSSCSAINLITAIAIGFEQFNRMLAGANSMDTHFLNSEFSCNLPVLLALIGVWNNNFLNIHNLLLLTYARQLELFLPHIQQLDMESNGKSIDNQGKSVNYATGPIIWGGLGNQAQHSYYQLLCQGTHKVTIDFITLDTFKNEIINDICGTKMKVLSYGVNHQENPNGFIPGNIPLNHIGIQDASPFTIGALIALYEHKIFTQSVIWDINPFDQPGVESTKRSIMLQSNRSEQPSPVMA